MVSACGGVGVAVRVDHTVPTEVQALFEQVRQEQDGRLDILVNDVWGGDELTEWNRPFWEHSLGDGLLMQERAVHSHMITSYYGAPLMSSRGSGLLVEVTDGVNYDCRGNLYYSLAKISSIHLAACMARELMPYGVTCLAISPGFLRSEAMLDLFGVTEANWREGAKKDPHFAASETPYYIGRAVVALACDPDVASKAGKALGTWELASEYGFTDRDGTQPDWGTWFRKHVQETG